jgi:hypothetical protein
MKHIIPFLIVSLFFGCAEKHKPDAHEGVTVSGIGYTGDPYMLDSISSDLPHDTGIYKKNADQLRIPVLLHTPPNPYKKGSHHWRKENFFGDNLSEEPFATVYIDKYADSSVADSAFYGTAMTPDMFGIKDTACSHIWVQMYDEGVANSFGRVKVVCLKCMKIEERNPSRLTYGLQHWNIDPGIFRPDTSRAKIKVTQDSVGNYIITATP